MLQQSRPPTRHGPTPSISSPRHRTPYTSPPASKKVPTYPSQLTPHRGAFFLTVRMRLPPPWALVSMLVASFSRPVDRLSRPPPLPAAPSGPEDTTDHGALADGRWAPSDRPDPIPTNTTIRAPFIPDGFWAPSDRQAAAVVAAQQQQWLAALAMDSGMGPGTAGAGGSDRDRGSAVSAAEGPSGRPPWPCTTTTTSSGAAASVAGTTPAPSTAAGAGVSAGTGDDRWSAIGSDVLSVDSGHVAPPPRCARLPFYQWITAVSADPFSCLHHSCCCVAHVCVCADTRCYLPTPRLRERARGHLQGRGMAMLVWRE